MEREFELLSPPVDVADVIVNFGGTQGWFSSSQEAVERAATWKPGLLKRLRRVLTSAREQGRFVRFDFNASDETQIQGHCYPDARDSSDFALEKEGRIEVDDYRDAIVRGTSSEFESICRGVLALVGCRAPVLTPHSNDQGFDLFGEYSMEGRLDRRYHLGGPDRAMTVWIAGQAKKYADEVGVDHVREFIGARELMKLGIFTDGGKALERFTPKAYQPVYLFFMTTGRLTRGAVDLITQTGVVLFDLESIAVLLADHNVATGPSGFEQSLFDTWVKENQSA
ncbi:restriction endonuclease [Arthrobacter tumbae]|uniref:restriction endonuclease n=1 Tax=Arthrobacter tumbae TaxID=163874 RepID=UPI00195ADFF3|nr:restriction endonuclease [Arthrobacter tumbae]MBM7780939.1 hypothetical protein [Arthrobacter tumbae]